jgi:hypothetical protein
MSNGLYELRAAAHLNNVGVSLLHQTGSFQLALKTFADALAIIKAVTTQPAEEACSKECIEEKIQAAAHRLSKPASCAVRASKKIALEVLSDDEIDSSFPRGQKRGSNKDTFYLVRMEAVDYLAPNENALSVAAATIFYNYAIACQCLASTPHAKKGMQMLRFSLSTISCCKTEGSDYFEPQFRRISLVTMLTLCQLVDLSHQFGMPGKCKEYLSRLSSVRYDFSRLTAMESKLPAHPARAA